MNCMQFGDGHAQEKTGELSNRTLTQVPHIQWSLVHAWRSDRWSYRSPFWPTQNQRPWPCSCGPTGCCCIWNPCGWLLAQIAHVETLELERNRGLSSSGSPNPTAEIALERKGGDGAEDSHWAWIQILGSGGVDLHSSLATQPSRGNANGLRDPPALIKLSLSKSEHRASPFRFWF